ncbi:MAG: hypothetical protein LQ338_003274 [Usnochroma carphineum]|nr:MAG: hypothetical protein LQ338_003274 [Usnochroma carphineum]
MATEKPTEFPHSETASQSPPYSAFTSLEKRIIVAIVSYAAWFSTLTSFIYYPVIHQLAQTFSVSVDKINLTVTSYMAVATLAPTLVGDAADTLGRRPIYGLALSLYVGANVAIALADSYAALVGLRVVQALAISELKLRWTETLGSKIYNTLLVDKNYQTPAAAQASSNIVRCALAAIAVSFLQDLIDGIGIGWSFTFLGGLCSVAMGLFGIDFCKGTLWRQRATASSSRGAHFQSTL